MGHKKRYVRHHVYILLIFVFIVLTGSITIIWYLSTRPAPATITQAKASTEVFDPENTKNNLKISTDLYTMELPSDWKQISIDRDTRYSSIKWEMQSGFKNRWIELYTDRIPTDQAFNKIVPITIDKNNITIDTISDNCSTFTPREGEANLKVRSEWQDASFLCDLSNYTDNIVGVSDVKSGVIFSLTGMTKGKHSYMFVYTDRGIPEDITPLTTAVKSLSPK